MDFVTASSSGSAAPWLCDPIYDGMSPKAREASWRAAEERRQQQEACDREQAEELVRRWEQDDQRNGYSNTSPKPSAPRFVPIAIDDVRLSAEPIWLIDGLLPARGLACVVGPPKSGKSFLTTDMLCAVARAVPYAGRDTVGGPVIYLTGEGVQGFQRRVIAMRQHLGIEGQGVPFFHIEHVPDLGSEQTDLPQLIADLGQFIAANCPGGICAIALDTLARCMGEADENSARDMGRFVNRCAAIERHFGCVVIVVHHVGKDPNRGGRGSNALNGAADVTMMVEKTDAFSTVRIDEMKDGREGQEWTFRLVPYDLKAQLFDRVAPLSESCAFSTCIVEILSEPEKPQLRATFKAKPPIGVAGDLLNIIRRAVDEDGTTSPDSPAVPRNVRAVSRANLRRYCETMAWQDGAEPRSWSAQLSNNLSKLRAARLIGFDKDWVWFT
jgi:AAA domain